MDWPKIPMGTFLKETIAKPINEKPKKFFCDIKSREINILNQIRKVLQIPKVAALSKGDT